VTQQEVNRVNAAMKSLTKHLDRFETICAKNNSPLRGVYYTNSPTTEFSSLRVAFRRVKRKTASK
jgi:hypothetical protein